jgi:hypothetical protein
MKILFVIGIVVLVLGVLSLVIPIPRTEHSGIQAGGIHMGVETSYDEKVSPIISAVLILGGVGLMIAGKQKSLLAR